jgi:hypothetical protein
MKGPPYDQAGGERPKQDVRGVVPRMAFDQSKGAFHFRASRLGGLFFTYTFARE